MKIEVTGEAKEIAALVLALQERRSGKPGKYDFPKSKF